MISLRVATWNIHGAVGADGQCLPERIADVVRSMEADIVALQEVDGRVNLGRRGEAFETFAALLGGNVVEARLFGEPGREHGNLLWTRYPIARHAVHLLPGGLEQRGLIEAEISLGSNSLRVFATHLGLSPLARRAQAMEAAQQIGSRNGPAILMGDFNEWRRSGGVNRRLRRLLANALCPRTFPAHRPLLPLDRIYATEHVTLHPVRPPKEAEAASDHLPLIADITVRSEAVEKSR